MTMVTAIASLLAAWVAVPAIAGERPCADDVRRLCTDVAPGAARVLRCLEGHRDRLTPACRVANDARLSVRARRHPCVDDRARFCPDVPNGQGKILACLRGHVAQLSSTCRSAVAPRTDDPTR